MLPAETESFDFFISHRDSGGQSASEIRGVLAEAGFSVVSQHPDIAYGDNFVARMHQFLKSARDLVVVLTSDYDQSQYTLLELTSFMAAALNSPQPRRLLVIRVEDCEPPGLLAAFNYVDLVGRRDPAERRAVILAAAASNARLDFTTARRTAQTALRHHLIRDLTSESAKVEALIGAAARTRLLSIDSHASGITTDFGASIREFLALYSGTGSAKDVFCGRERELAELTRWLGTPGEPPYRLIVGSAGRGKSMLVVRWSLDVVATADLDVVFVPISIRCQTNTATVVLQALVSRLARLHRQEAPLLSGVVPQVLCDLARQYLQQERADGRKTLVILDGLDEAVDKEIFRALLPSNPPPSLRVLLAARTHEGSGGDDDEWRTQLGFGPLALPARRDLLRVTSLDRLSFDSVASTVAETLSGALSTDLLGSATSELFRLSEGEPFVLALYLQRLLESKTPLGASALEELRGLEPGIRACFADWWAQQAVLWKNEQVNESTIVSVLAVLSTACGGMTVDDIQSFLDARLSGYAIGGALTHLRRFLVTTAGGRVAIFHDRFAEFVRTTLMSAREVEAARARFVDWGLAAASSHVHAAPGSRPDVPVYVLRHLGSHLHGREVAPERLTPLLSKAWADLWLDLEGNHGGFIGDAGRILNICTGRFKASSHPDDRRRAFRMAIDAALARGSAISVAEGLPTPLLELLVKDRIWTEDQALAYVRTIRKSETAKKALGAIAGLLHPRNHRAFIEAAFAISSDDEARGALSAIAPHVSGAAATAYVENVARFPAPRDRAWLLREIDSSSDGDLREAVLALLGESRTKAKHEHELAELAISERQHVAPAQQEALFQEALRHARAITGADDRILGPSIWDKLRLLCALADRCEDMDEGRALAREALDICRSQHNYPLFDHAFSSEASTFARWIFPEALAYARQRGKEGVISLIGSVALSDWPDEAEEVQKLVLETVESFKGTNGPGFYHDTWRLKTHLSSDLLKRFSAAIEQMPETSRYRWQCQMIRLERLSFDERQELARSLFAGRDLIARHDYSVEILSKIIAYLPPDERGDAARTVLLSSRALRDDDYYCVKAIAGLTAYIGDPSEPLSEAAANFFLPEPERFAKASSVLRRLLADRPQLAGQVLEAIATNGGRPELDTLICIAPYVTAKPTLQQYETCSRMLESRYEQTAAMFALLGAAPAGQLDIEALRRWLVELPSADRWGYFKPLPATLTPPQSAFLADHHRSVRNLGTRIYIGGRIEPELRRRGTWIRCLEDMLEGVGSTQAEWSFREGVRGCTWDELEPILAASETHASVGVQHQLLSAAIEKAPAGDRLDEIARRLLTIAEDPANWTLVEPGWADVIGWIAAAPVSDRVIGEMQQLSTRPDRWDSRMRRAIAPRIDVKALDTYVDAARKVWPHSDGIQELAAVFDRLSLERRNSLFSEMTDWLETYYCGAEAAVRYMRLSELCTSAPGKVFEAAFNSVRSTMTIGASVSKIEEFVTVIQSWVDTRRIDRTTGRAWLARLLDELSAYRRSEVVQVLAGMGPSLRTLAEISPMDVVDRIVQSNEEWR